MLRIVFITTTLLTLLLMVPVTAYAQAHETAGERSADQTPTDLARPGLTDRLDALSAELSDLYGEMNAPVNAAGGRLAALLFRQDQRALELLREFISIATQITNMPESSVERGQLAARLTLGSDQVDAYFSARLTALEARIDQQLLRLETLSGVERVTREAEIEALDDQRLGYVEKMISVVDIRQELGFPAGQIDAVARTSLLNYADELVGEIEFHAAARASIRKQLADAPDDADLRRAQEVESHEAARAVEMLQRVVVLLEKMTVDTTTYRRLLISESTSVAVSLVDVDVLTMLTQELLASGQAWFSNRAFNVVFQLVLFVAILMLARFIARFARAAVKRAMEKQGDKVSRLLTDVTVSSAGIAVITLGLLIALAQMGISVAPMLAGLGVAGFIIGFALQDTLGNFASGGMILAYRPFDTGDYIAVAGVEGTVKRMNLVSTTITTIDNQVLIVPNSKIWGDVIRNYTQQHVRRVDMEFSISYEDSIEKAETILAEVLSEIPAVLKSPEPVIRVHRLGESSVDLICRPWVKTENYWETYWTLQRMVKLRFDANQITIPFPQRTLHVSSEERSAPV